GIPLTPSMRPRCVPVLLHYAARFGWMLWRRVARWGLWCRGLVWCVVWLGFVELARFRCGPK
uniref:Uncharacterized protein n=1 Tax=Aegilops tauschii subsp. strangulata TaxID=200361 RepID=A0A452XYE6_AEGTS